MGDKVPRVVVIGGGFAGLSAAYELTRHGVPVILVERESSCGGLAGSFEVNGVPVERFYHHWFASDEHAFRLVKELGAEGLVVHRPTRTGLYFRNRIFPLSKPYDLLRFTPLSFRARIRLMRLVLSARSLRDWKSLESVGAKEWLVREAGSEGYGVLWEHLLRGKFGPFASEVSAVWIWNKLKLRGGSRNRRGLEVLSYFQGGFAALVDRMVKSIASAGGIIETETEAESFVFDNGKVSGVKTSRGFKRADRIIATTALPIVSNLIGPCRFEQYKSLLRNIEYLSNICMVLELDRRLSPIYWLNVGSAEFPFVGVIEHTNLEPPENYGGRHIVYLSKYLPETDRLFTMRDSELVEYFLIYLKKIFPGFHSDWILGRHVWRARYAQPVVGRHYSQSVPSAKTPIPGLYLSTMAQVYPEDRGTNYAVREGRRIGRMVAEELMR